MISEVSFGGGLGLCLCTANAQASPAAAPSEVTLIARFVEDPDATANQALLASLNCEISWKSKLIDGLVVLHCPLHNAVIASQVLIASSRVKYAEQSSGAVYPNSTPECSGIGTPTSLETGPYDLSPLQWSVLNSGQTVAGVEGKYGCDMNLAPAWNMSAGNSSVVVAIIDPLGVDITRPELSSSLWTNPGEIPNDDIDNDGNGVVDDVHGVNYGDPESAGKTWGDPTPGPTGEGVNWSHGTSCAGLIFGSHSDGGIDGMAPGCRLLSVRLWSGGEDIVETKARSVIALEYCILAGVRVSSWSFRFGHSAAYEDMIEVAHEHKHIIVASANNFNLDIDTHPEFQYPARYGSAHNNVFAVAALDNRDCLAQYVGGQGSNYGLSSVLIGAPGWNNISINRGMTAPPGPYVWFEGTSAAAPHVAGAIALLLSVHPELTVPQIRQRLINTGRPVPSLAGKTISGKALDVKHLLDGP